MSYYPPFRLNAPRRHFHTKKAEDMRERDEIRRVFREWYTGCLRARRLLTPGMHREGLDYHGDEGWPVEMSIAALHREFVGSTGAPVNRQTCCRLAKEVGLVTSSHARPYELLKDNGKPLLKGHQTFYKISPLPDDIS